ncbi:hypothetical protein NDU88_003457 [Pleurodeles waltl]|uniref:Uncharacterized protein n=1 Tax=Pleurodeles waltl TaxID=8319 RepID=A0AAV7TNK2_PLEWA|nr:hypothetical protein NDU88_003457 [Pleurodeles waltl]
MHLGHPTCQKRNRTLSDASHKSQSANYRGALAAADQNYFVGPIDAGTAEGGPEMFAGSGEGPVMLAVPR